MNAAICALVVAAGCSYHAGSYADLRGPFPGTRVTVGCVDLAVGLGPESTVEAPVVAYGFGNHCRHAVMLDLATVRAVGHDAEDREHAMIAFDPNQELRPMPLDGMWSGREQVEYGQARGLEAVPLVSLCVDIGGIDGTAERIERWVCPLGGSR